LGVAGPDVSEAIAPFAFSSRKTWVMEDIFSEMVEVGIREPGGEFSSVALESELNERSERSDVIPEGRM